MTTLFHGWLYGRFIEIQSNLRRKKLHRINQGFNCFLEVDLDCLNGLHNLHNDYPLAGKKIKVTEEMLSEQQSKITEDNNFSLGTNKKLISNLGNK